MPLPLSCCWEGRGGYKLFWTMRVTASAYLSWRGWWSKSHCESRALDDLMGLNQHSRPGPATSYLDPTTLNLGLVFMAEPMFYLMQLTCGSKQPSSAWFSTPPSSFLCGWPCLLVQKRKESDGLMTSCSHPDRHKPVRTGQNGTSGWGIREQSAGSRAALRIVPYPQGEYSCWHPPGVKGGR